MATELHKDHRSRMRERFKKNGAHAFEEHELLEMLLFSAIPRRNTNDIAHELLYKFGDIPNVLTADEAELCSVSGIGNTAAEQLRFFGEMYSHVSAAIFKSVPLNTEDSAGMYSMLRMSIAPAESAIAVYLDGDGIRVFEEYLYKGKPKLTEKIVDHIIQKAEETNAASILLMHNHKHEPLKKSPDDIVVTKCLRRDAEKIGIDKVMHVIVSDDGYIHI